MVSGLSVQTAALVVSYGPIAIGVILGIAGRYGQTLHEAGQLRGQSLRADILQFGVLSLIAIWIADTAHLEGNTRVMAAAMCGAAGERMYRIVVNRFIKRAEGDANPVTELAAAIKASPATIAELPAGATTPDAVTLRAPRSAPPLQRELRTAFHDVIEQRPPDDHIAALIQMKGPASPGPAPRADPEQPA